MLVLMTDVYVTFNCENYYFNKIRVVLAEHFQCESRKKWFVMLCCVCHASQTSCYQRNLCPIFCIFSLSYQERWFHACVELLSQ